MVKPNKKFDLEVEELEIIEICVHKEINRLAHQRLMHVDSTIVPEEDLESVKEIDLKIKQLHNILGKLHTQKVWYRPPKRYVSG